MKGVLRQALMYIFYSPLWWLGAILGLPMMLATLFIPSLHASMLYPAGTMLLVALPAVLGGAGLRAAGGGKPTPLRPGAQWKLLLSGHLAILLLVGIAVITVWLPVNAGWLPPNPKSERLLSAQGTLTYAAYAWSFIAGAWLMMFAMFLSRATYFLTLFALIGGGPTIKLANHVLAAWHLEFSLNLTKSVIGLMVLWVAAGLWYLKQGRLQTLTGMFQSRHGKESRTTAAQAELPARTHAREAMFTFLTGNKSLSSFARVNSMTWVAVLLYLGVANGLGTHKHPALLPALLVGMSPAITLVMAYTVTRRARLLWLRTGSDRTTMFSTSERIGWQSTAVQLSLMVLPLLAYVAWTAPDLLHQAVRGSAFIIVACAAAFYWGMALIRGRRVFDVCASAAFVVAWVVSMIVLAQGEETTDARVAALTLGCALLIPAIRMLARHRWQSIDWHLRRPPQFAGRSQQAGG